jgi:DNA-binding LacI/PurR family transcriptional regulator
MRQPYDRLSTEMLRLMLAAIDGEPPLAVALPAELILRESA